MAENPLTKLPLAGQLGVAGTAALLVIGGFWYFYWNPKVQEQAAKTKQLETLRKEIQKLEVTASKLPEFQREVAELEKELEALKQILPAGKETADLMRRVQALASESRLTVKKFTPRATVRKEFSAEPAAAGPRRPAAPAAKGAAAAAPKDYYEEWPIDVDIDGNYHNLGLFFDRIGRFRRLVNIGSLKVKAQRDPTASRTISVGCVATTYVYVEAAPAAPAAGAGR